MIEAGRALPVEMYELSRGSSHDGMKGTLDHTYGSDLVWMRRVRGIPTTRADITMTGSPTDLENS
jgi:uncharacterized damage-inducible protein DinB